MRFLTFSSWLVIVSGLFATVPVHATLQAVAGNGLVINDTDLDIAWAQDANLFRTQAASYSGGPNAFVAAVINSVGGVITDTPNPLNTPTFSGSYNLTAGDFDPDTGSMTWWGAKAWIAYLNGISYAGVNNWRLPTVTDTGPSGCDFSFSGTDCGYNVDTSSSELAHLFHSELNNLSQADTSGVPRGGVSQVTWGMANTGPFTNAEYDQNSSSNLYYWTDTESLPVPDTVWYFFMADGLQWTYSKSVTSRAWAVRTGQVTAVPIPAALLLFGSAVLSLAGWNVRRSIQM